MINGNKNPTTAYFVRHPRTVRDLMVLHPVDQEQPFEIVKKIYLPMIDYENFLTDMTVDRVFIEACTEKCKGGPVRQCLFVYSSNPREGILVSPEDGRWVGEAAYYSLSARHQ